jgi:hypothetical protein
VGNGKLTFQLEPGFREPLFDHKRMKIKIEVNELDGFE